MTGEVVEHIRFGRGTVTAFAPPRIRIAFEDGTVKTFAYPESVGRFLRFEGEGAAERARGDRERAEIIARENAAARLAAERERAEETTRLRMEAIHEKRAAAAKRTAARRTKQTGGSMR